jgi:hypothetical protein
MHSVLVCGDFRPGSRATSLLAIVQSPSAVNSKRVLVEPLAIIPPPGEGTSIIEDDIFDGIDAGSRRWRDATFVLDPSLGGGAPSLAERIDGGYPGQARPPDRRADRDDHGRERAAGQRPGCPRQGTCDMVIHPRRPMTTCLDPLCPHLVEATHWCFDHLRSCHEDEDCPHPAHTCEDASHYCPEHGGPERWF